MADEDPYNFEIAIPPAAGGGRVQASTYARYGASNSDEEDDGGGGDLDDDEEEEEDRTSSHRGARQAPTRVGATKATPVATTTAGGGNALDKPKSFLSKYSVKPVETKAPAAASSHRSRVELTLDDDDELSLDSSRDVSRRADSVDEREHDTSSYYEDESPVKQPVRANAVETSRSALTTTVAKAEATVRPFRADSDQDNDYDERDDKKGDAPPPYSAPAVAAAVSAPAYASANQWNPTAAAATRHGDSDGEEEHSIEAESVASQSEILESQDQSDYREAQPVASRPTRAIAMEQSAPSESGVYEEEVFEEESVPTSPDSRPAVRQPLVEPNQASPLPSVTATKTEPTFDYSMNFSDDGDTDRQAPASASVGPLPAASSVRAEPTVSDADDDYESEGERSALLESDDNSHESQPGDGPPPVSSSAPPASATASPPYNAPTDAEAEYSDELVPSLGGHSAAKLVPVATIGSGKTAETDKQREEVKRPQLSAKSAASDENEGSDNAAATREEDHVTGHASQSQQGVRATKTSNARLQPSTRPKVVIVRAYEASSAEKPEMRDASTQFTGNHAGIQTELVPDGMHNLQEPQRSVPAAYVEQDLGRETFESATRTTPPPPPLQPPPAPTVQPTAGSLPLPSYSLNMLHQPLAASTSLYKQQLLALQEQIRQKKRETERLVSERMSFQYGSLRGTERFIAGRRPPKLQLWETLMRVDPTLDEKKAKEAARLAQRNFTA